jgi:hypothetical protein
MRTILHTIVLGSAVASSLPSVVTESSASELTISRVERTVADITSAPASPLHQALDACALLSHDRIEAITGARPKAADSRPGTGVATCSWTVDDPYPNYPVVSLIVTAQGQATWEAFTASLIAGEMEEIVRSGERVDIGRFGLYDERMLIVVTPGGSTMMLSVTPPFRSKTGRNGVLALARTVLERLA